MEKFKSFLKAIKDRVVAFHNRKQASRRFYATLIALTIFGGLGYLTWPSDLLNVDRTPTISYTDFMGAVERDEIKEVKINIDQFSVLRKDGTHVRTRVDGKFASPVTQMREHGVTIHFVETEFSPLLQMRRYFLTLGMMLTVIIWIYFLAKGIGPKGEIIFKPWGTRTTKVTTNGKKVTFADVAGIDEVRADLQE